MYAETQRTLRARAARCCATLLAGVILSLGVGCELDSYLDPSVVGRWEYTPTTTPILERLSAIEDVGDGFVEYSEISAEDLIPEAAAYRVAPGDVLEIMIDGLFTQGQREVFPARVDPLGTISIPQLEPIAVTGMTAEQVRDQVVASIARAGLARNALVQVRVAEQRQQSYTVFGAVVGTGPYLIPKPDFRLLEALTTAGGFNESARHIYVIRQVPLSDAPARPAPPAPSPRQPTTPDRPTGPADGEAPSLPDFLDLIDDLTGEPSPTMMRSTATQSRPSSAQLQPSRQDTQDPMIDLVESRAARVTDRASISAVPGAPTRWVFLDGRWVQVTGSLAGGTDRARTGEVLVTQRVIRIPVEPLVNGDARYNIVVRPGDLIRVPPFSQGNVYMAGQVNRAGVYSLPVQGSFTLTRAVTAAGGFGPLAIPERTDITRMVGTDRQATMRVNLRAIAEGTQPDILLKPDDHINVGTNFWAYPLAVFRNGLRMSYGFGFLLDRNFGNDVFGPPPTNDRR